ASPAPGVPCCLPNIRTSRSACGGSSAARRTRHWADSHSHSDRRLLFPFRDRRPHGAARLDLALAGDLDRKYSGANNRLVSSAADLKHPPTHTHFGFVLMV